MEVECVSTDASTALQAEHGLHVTSATQTLTLPRRLRAAPIKVLGTSAVMRHPHLPDPARACDPNPHTTTRRLPAAPVKVLGMCAVMRHPHLPYPARACDPNPHTTTAQAARRAHQGGRHELLPYPTLPGLVLP